MLFFVKNALSTYICTNNNDKDMKTLDNTLFNTLLNGLDMVGEFLQEGIFLQYSIGKTVLELIYSPDAENEIDLYRLDAAFELELSKEQKNKIINEADRIYNYEMGQEEYREKTYEHPSLIQQYA